MQAQTSALARAAVERRAIGFIGRAVVLIRESDSVGEIVFATAEAYRGDTAGMTG